MPTPSPNPVAVCPIVDTSASMSPWVASTQINSKAFLAYALPGDGIGVVNYDTQGTILYPLATVDSTLSQVAAAGAKIDGLSFNGNCTNMGDGIAKANSTLGTSSLTTRAAVLLSDGLQNCGTDPSAVPATYPVYTVGMGNGYSRDMMTGIASRTNAVFYDAPQPINMMRIYNQIRGNAPTVNTVVNFLATLSNSQQSVMLPASVANTSQLNQIGVVWNNTAYTYTSSSAPGVNQIYVALYDPSGRISTAPPSRSAGGYVIFDLPTPTPGTWTVYALYNAASGNALSVTTGVFEFTAAGAADIRLGVTPTAKVAAGGRLVVNARLMADDEPVAIQTAHVEIQSPTISIARALKKYSDEIAGMAWVGDEPSHDVDTPEQRLAALHRLCQPNLDLMPRRTTAAPMSAGEDGSFQAVAVAGDAGPHTVIVHAQGYSEKSKSPIQRTELVTVMVGDA